MTKEKRLKYVPVPDFNLIAIASSEDAYRLSWVINQLFGIQLKRTEPLRVWDEKTENPRDFVCYTYTSASQQSDCRLISNKSESGLLESKYSKFDYFLQIRHFPGFQMTELVEQLNTQKDILMAVQITSPGKALTQKLMI
ncbi:MAG: IPExxxVDY family protein [Bacteroidota bacterium]|nr:IPExxxVDY family protein [Bacteroidota bacterium]